MTLYSDEEYSKNINKKRAPKLLKAATKGDLVASKLMP